MNLRLILDSGIILAVIFSAGIGWQKLGQVEAQVARLITQDSARTGSEVRLARIEVELQNLNKQVDRLNRKLDGD